MLVHAAAYSGIRQGLRPFKAAHEVLMAQRLLK